MTIFSNQSYEDNGTLVVLRKNLDPVVGLINGSVGLLYAINLNFDGSVHSLCVDFGGNLNQVFVYKSNTSHLDNLLYDCFPITLYEDTSNHSFQGTF